MPTADENSIAIEFAWDELGQVRMARLRVRAGTRLGEALVRAAQQGLLPVQRAQAAAGALAIFGPAGEHPERYGGGEISLG